MHWPPVTITNFYRIPQLFVFDKGAFPVLMKCCFQRHLGIHDNRSTPGDRFVQGLSGQQ